MPSAVNPGTNQSSYDTAMVTHSRKSYELAVLERPEYDPGMCPVLYAIRIKEDREEPRSYKESDYGRDEEILSLIITYIDDSIMSALISEDQICEEECDKIHHGIPSYR